MLAELWGIEWLFWWQIPLLFVLMVGVWLPAWLFGGGDRFGCGGRAEIRYPRLSRRARSAMLPTDVKACVPEPRGVRSPLPLCGLRRAEGGYRQIGRLCR